MPTATSTFLRKAHHTVSSRFHNNFSSERICHRQTKTTSQAPSETLRKAKLPPSESARCWMCAIPLACQNRRWHLRFHSQALVVHGRKLSGLANSYHYS